MRAVLLGGTGAMGGATAMMLSEAGWSVDVTGRDPSRMPKALTEAGVNFHQIDRHDIREVQHLIGHGADLLVDLLAYSAPHVRALLPALADVTNMVLISSRAVYTDDAGRHLNGDAPPRFTSPLSETAPTVPPAADDVDPDTREGYAPGKVAAELAALESGFPVTVIRPSKVHGRWARNARTSSVIQLLRSGVERIELAQASTIDHLSAAKNVAALIHTVAPLPGRRILNAADPDAPTAEDIVRIIAAELSWNGHIERAIDGAELFRHPWQTAMTLDTTAALKMAYRPVGNAVDLITDEVRWLLSTEMAR